jgi:hypothetical protein
MQALLRSCGVELVRGVTNALAVKAGSSCPACSPTLTCPDCICTGDRVARVEGGYSIFEVVAIFVIFAIGLGLGFFVGKGVQIPLSWPAVSPRAARCG